MITATDGFRHLLRGFSLIRAPGVRLFVVIPFLINLLVFSTLIWIAADQFDRLMQWMSPELPDWLAWLAWLAWVLFGLLTLMLVFYTFTIVANLVGAPFNGFLAERVARHLGVPAPAASTQTVLQQMWTDIRQEFRKLGYFLGRAAALAILSLILIFIPGVNALVPVLWFLFGAWMLALEYSDFHLANLGYTFDEEKRLLAQNRWSALGFGAAATGATLIPIVNFLVMPAAVAGAVSMWAERLGSDSSDPVLRQ